MYLIFFDIFFCPLMFNVWGERFFSVWTDGCTWVLSNLWLLAESDFFDWIWGRIESGEFKIYRQPL